jgi:alginate O-acetyltransferase complex protein AlgJ
MSDTTQFMTSPKPTPHQAFAALAFIAVMLVGAWQITAAALNSDGLEFPRTLLDFREGRTTQELEKQLDKHLPVRSSLIAGANTLRYLITGGGGDQVRTGRDQWLFLTEELRYDAGGAANLQARADMLGTAALRLNEQGVKLVVALVPDKARIYETKLASGQYPAYNQSRYQDALAALRERKVTTVDLLQPLTQAAAKSEVFYRTDTHWNQVGAEVVARAVASQVQQLGISLDTTTFKTTSEGSPVERVGDLVRLMGLQDMPNALRPTPDQEAAASTSQTSAESAGGGLFGDVAAVPVVMTGTSYSMRGNFHGYMQQALSSKVLNTAKDGGGFLQAATAYLTDEAFRSAKPKVLIWEVPERFLMTKLDDEPKWLAKVKLKP